MVVYFNLAIKNPVSIRNLPNQRMRCRFTHLHAGDVTNLCIHFREHGGFETVGFAVILIGIPAGFAFDQDLYKFTNQLLMIS